MFRTHSLRSLTVAALLTFAGVGTAMAQPRTIHERHPAAAAPVIHVQVRQVPRPSPMPPVQQVRATVPVRAPARTEPSDAYFRGSERARSERDDGRAREEASPRARREAAEQARRRAAEQAQREAAERAAAEQARKVAAEQARRAAAERARRAATQAHVNARVEAQRTVQLERSHVQVRVRPVR